MSSVKFPPLDSRMITHGPDPSPTHSSSSQSRPDSRRSSQHRQSSSQTPSSSQLVQQSQEEGISRPTTPPTVTDTNSHHTTDDTNNPIIPQSLSSLVSASLANASAHERAILKWSREIQREMEEYKALLARKNQAVKDRRKKEQLGLALLGRNTTLEVGGRGQPSHSTAGSAQPAMKSAPRENFWPGGGFLRDDIQSVTVRSKGKARFYPTNLVKVQSIGSLSARESKEQSNSPTRPGRRAAQPRGSMTTRPRKASVMAPNGSGSLTNETSPERPPGGVNQLYNMFGAPIPNPSASSEAPPSPTAAAALLSLPPALSANELKPAIPGVATSAELDESAAFKSPALYMDMKMRQLFHPDIHSVPLSTSQKVHVIAHLLDTLGELVEPDSQQAYQTLSDTIKELILSSEYKNLISVGPTNGMASSNMSHSSSSAALGTKSSLAAAVSAAGQATAQSLMSLQKELSRREKSKWDVNGVRKQIQSIDHPHQTKLLSQSLADGSLDGNGSMVNGKFMTKLEKQKERERLERERMEKEYFAKHGGGPVGSHSKTSQSAQSFIQDVESRRRPVPQIVFGGDASEAARVRTGPVNGVEPYRSTAVTLPPTVFPTLRQIPASFIEVAWSLKTDVENLCQRLDACDLARRNQEAELAKNEQEQEYLAQWNQKKNLQLQLYQRSEVNLANEITLLKSLLIDLKEEYETITEETILLEEDYLAHGIVFGGSYAMEEFRFEEEHRNYPLELQKKRREMEITLQRIENFKQDLNEIHNERDLLLTRIEVLEQAVNMMHNDDESDEDESDSDEDDSSDDEQAAKKAAKEQKEKEAAAAATVQQVLDPNGYPFKQHRSDDLRGRGVGNLSVPTFLRFNGFFPNLNYTKQEVEVKVKEIWSLKTIADEKAKQVGGHQTGLRQYFEEYLQKRFKKDELVHEKKKNRLSMEPAQNLLAGKDDPSYISPQLSPSDYAMQEFVVNFFSTLSKHFIDQDFILFLKVILGELNEEHYRDQMKMLANFKEAIFRWDLSEHMGGMNLDMTHSNERRIDGLISKEVFLKGLRDFFPHKSDRHMKELEAILERDCMSFGQVDGRKILSDGEIDDGDDSNQHEGAEILEVGGGTTDPNASVDASEAAGGIYTSNFLECIRHQYLVEIDMFVTKIRNDLYALHEVRKLESAKKLAATDENANSYSAMRHLERSDTKPAMLTAYDIRHVLRASDLHRSTEDLTDFLKRGCNEPYLSKDTEISIDKFMNNLVASGLVHTTNHWRRIPAKNPSLELVTSSERESMLAEEERKAILASELLGSSPRGSGVYNLGHSTSKPYFHRRASMEDESQYFAARAGTNTENATTV